MFDPEKSTTPRQDLVAKRAERAEEYAKMSENPEMPWMLGKLVAFEAFRMRPTRFEAWLAKTTDNMNARTNERNERSEAELQEAIGKFRRFRAGEPQFVPPSSEVIQMQFISDQEAAIQQNPSDEPKPPEPPTQ